MRLSIVILLYLCLFSVSSAQNISEFTETEAINLTDRLQGTKFQHTENPEAQWFSKAGFGLFIHWGIHSVVGIDPSWSMLANCPWLKNDRIVSHEKYYSLANEFNPENYDPGKWVLAAKYAGFQYLVITAKRHDSYCLWPSNYGKYNTKTYMGGRDLLKPLVDACRKHHLRIGFYFSPRDWSNPDYPMAFEDYNYDKRVAGNRYPAEINQQKFDVFFKYHSKAGIKIGFYSNEVS